MLKKFRENIDMSKAKQMLLGVTGIYGIFLLHGLLLEKITKTQYLNSNSNAREQFRITSGLILVERIINYILGLIYMHFTVPGDKKVVLPQKNSAIVGGLIWLANITQTQSIYLVSFPLIVMAKSCNVLSVVLVGVFCSRVRTKDLKLGPKKIIVAIIVSTGIILFRVFDPIASFQDNQSTELIGLALLLVSLLSDGFVPDFQAQIKEKYKPTPIQMLLNINKWSGIFALAYLLILWQLPDFVIYCVEHIEFTVDMLGLSILSFVGQIFVYRMVNAFKQHIVSLIVTTRKIMTVALSILYFKHQTSIGQILSIFVVLGVTMYEFLSSVMKKQEKSGQNKSITQLVEEIQTTFEVETSKQNNVKEESKNVQS